MKKALFVLGVSIVALSACGSEHEESEGAVVEEKASAEMLAELSAAQKLEGDIEKLNREIDSLLNSF